jgi:murein DD-endopeptidase MepM/ murein hydrolase activator NlpD
MRLKTSVKILLLLAVLAALAPATVDAQTGPKGGKGKMGLKGSAGDAPQDRGKSSEGASGRANIQSSGIVPQFDPSVRCPSIASPFASPTRYDGSKRPFGRYGGLHGGFDISLAEGTPLLAIAGGRVAHKGEGGQAEGIFLWLQHSPDDTGLPFWVYSKYQHFREMPALAVGASVKPGQRVGISGRSGTVGGHYGANGYPHLHLTTIASPSGQYEARGSLVSSRSPRFFDPVAIYQAGWRDINQIAGPGKRGTVQVAHAKPDGSLSPSTARLVWPVMCRPR